MLFWITAGTSLPIDHTLLVSGSTSSTSLVMTVWFSTAVVSRRGASPETVTDSWICVHLQQKIGARGRLCVNNNVLDSDGAETGELPCDGVAPRHQPRELIGSARVGHGDLVAADRARIGEGNGHARHDGARRVRRGAADRAETALREGRRRRTQAHEHYAD